MPLLLVSSCVCASDVSGNVEARHSHDVSYVMLYLLRRVLLWWSGQVSKVVLLWIRRRILHLIHLRCYTGSAGQRPDRLEREFLKAGPRRSDAGAAREKCHHSPRRKATRVVLNSLKSIFKTTMSYYCCLMQYHMCTRSLRGRPRR